MNDSMLTFDNFADLLLRHRCFQSPSALHAMLTTYIACLPQLTPAQSVRMGAHFLSEDENPAQLTPVDVQTLESLHQQIDETLTGNELNFELLLPDEVTYSLPERVKALVVWLQVFERTLKTCDLENKKLSAELSEGLDTLRMVLAHADMKEIDAMDPEDEANEKDYFALSDYARMVVMMLYTELHPQRPHLVMDEEMTPTSSYVPASTSLH